MSTAATVLTQQNLQHIKRYMQNKVIDIGLKRKSGLALFMDQEKVIIPTSSVNDRTLVSRITKMNGDIKVMPADGIPSGNTKYSEGDHFEEGFTMTVKYGEWKIAEDDLKILNDKLSCIDLGKYPEQGNAVLKELGYDKLIEDYMYSDLLDEEEKALFDLIDGLPSLEIYGTDYVTATSGTLLEGNNLISKSFGPDIQDTILVAARSMKTVGGAKVAFNTPKYFFTTSVHLPDGYRYFAPNRTVNANQQSLFNYFDNNSTFVDDIGLTGDKSIAIGAGHGILVRFDSPEPRFIAFTDEHGNLNMKVKRASGFSICHRANIVEIDHS